MLWWNLRQLKSKNHDTRADAAWRLGDSKDPRAAEALIAALEDEPFLSGVVEALGKIRDERAVEPLVAMLVKGPRYSIVQALRNIAPGWRNSEAAQRAVSTFVAALKDKNSNVRLAAVGALREICDARALEPLMAAALEDEHPDVRLEAWNTLEMMDKGGIDGVRAPQPLIPLMPLTEALRDENREVRKLAVRLLQRSGDVRAVQPLVVALIKDTYKDLKEAHEALKTIT